MSQKSAVFKKIAIMSVIAGLLMSLCFKTVPQVKKETKPSEKIRATMTALREAQDTLKKKKSEAEDEIHSSASLAATEQPQFKGGLAAFTKFMSANYRLPQEALKNKVSGRIFLSFVVEKDGSLSNITSVRDLGYGTGDEGIRVLKMSPKWKPGMINGQPVRINYGLPININSY